MQVCLPILVGYEKRRSASFHDVVLTASRVESVDLMIECPKKMASSTKQQPKTIWNEDTRSAGEQAGGKVRKYICYENSPLRTSGWKKIGAG